MLSADFGGIGGYEGVGEVRVLDMGCRETGVYSDPKWEVDIMKLLNGYFTS